MHVWLIATPVNKAFVLIIETFILEHKHTLFRRRPVKAFKVIKSPEAFQLLADETRRRIIYLLRAKEMTVSQISAELGLTPQAIYHHIRKMRDADLVEVAREERVDHFIETYYRATAEMFNLSHGEGMSRLMPRRRPQRRCRPLQRSGCACGRIPKSWLGSSSSRSEWRGSARNRSGPRRLPASKTSISS